MPERTLPRIVLVSGFLGSGKTTLILRAAAVLQARGLRVAVITNDQDQDLVDTHLAEANGIQAGEVAGACFCCHFAELIETADRLAAFRPDVIFAEPVGSCIDLAATVLSPLLAFHADRYRVAPLSVLIDPDLAAQVRSGQAAPDVAFLFQKQLEEADVLCASKADIAAFPPESPWPVDYRMSGRTGQGIEEWLDGILSSTRVPGSRLLDVDYSRYAEAEAALGWLNIHADLQFDNARTPALVVGPLLDTIDSRLASAGAAIAHLKVFDRARTGFVKASVTRTGQEPAVEGDLSASADRHHELIVNLRAVADPELLRSVVHSALSEIGGKLTCRHDRAFRPAAPKPEHRFTSGMAR